MNKEIILLLMSLGAEAPSAAGPTMPCGHFKQTASSVTDALSGSDSPAILSPVKGARACVSFSPGVYRVP